ncbi:MAG: GSCFA domain-containing protein [Rikenellaceae bacterium]
MKFRTQIDIPQAKEQLDYSSSILCIGSCFALSIGSKLQRSKFTTEVNPMGVMFNPMSIASTLERLGDGNMVDKSELQQGREGWFHFDFHGSFSHRDPNVAVQKMNQAVDAGHLAFAQSDTVIITLGTAWIYQLLNSGVVAANCHKEPSRRFSRRAMSVDEVVSAVGAQVQKYPSKRFIFSLSPIRHLADGHAENSLSKATLRVAIAKIVELYSNASYFPAFEIMMDDLRDYRFYDEDMVHPSSQAVDYIWSKFCESQISAEAQARMQSVASIVRAAAHRPFDAASESYREFCDKQLELIKKHPNIDFGKESAFFRGQLQNNL